MTPASSEQSPDQICGRNSSRHQSQFRYLSMTCDSEYEANRGSTPGHLPVRSARKSGWKPITLHPVFLMCVAAFTAALIAILSYLTDLGERQAGLVFAPSVDDFSTLTTFAYLYLPTLISVFLSMVWAWIDLDIKRLEPFFQMSSVSGATAENSLLLQYPFDFIAWAPVKAFRRRHWGVFVGGMASIMIFWAITPLQGAIFDTRTIAQSQVITVPTVASVDSIKNMFNSEKYLNLGFLESAWSVIWHGSKLPRYATMNGTILPIEPNLSKVYGSGASVTVNTTLLTTTLDCEQIPLTLLDPTGTEFKVNISSDCEPMTSFDAEGPTLWYFGSQDDMRMDYSLSAVDSTGLGCSQEAAARGFLAVVSAPMSSKYNVSFASRAIAAFCTPRYWTQSVEVCLDIPTMTINHTVSLGPLLPLNSNALNTSLFERLMSTGQTPSGSFEYIETLNAPEANAIGQAFQLIPFNFTNFLYTTPMTGYILGVSKVNPSHFESLLTKDYLANILEQTHQLLFSIAMSSVLAKAELPESLMLSTTGTLTQVVSALVVVPALAYSMQSLLAIITLCALFLAMFYWQRPSHLACHPNSLRNVGKLDIDTEEADLQYSLAQSSHVRFKLLDEGSSGKIQTLQRNDEDDTSLEMTKEDRTTMEHQATLPVYLHAAVGVVFVMLLLGVLVTLLLLQRQSMGEQGLVIPWSNPITQQIVLNYLPTLVATLLEPYWTLLNRMLCLLQPFEELRNMKARAAASIDARYSSLPPQLTAMRALKQRHFLLTTVCSVAVSANILAVSMNALFDKKIALFPAYTAYSYTTRSEIFQNTSSIGITRSGDDISLQFQDHFYLANMNLTTGAPLPVWTAKDHFLLPMTPTGTNDDSNARTMYAAQVQGLGVLTDCEDLGLPSADGPFRLQPTISLTANGTVAHFGMNASVSLNDNSGRSHICSLPESSSVESPLSGPTALEMMTGFAESGNSSLCARSFFVMYARNLNTSSARTDPGITTDFRSIQGSSQTFLACRTDMMASNYSVKFLGTGQVVESLPSGPAADALRFFKSNASSLNGLLQRIIDVNTKRNIQFLDSDFDSVVGHNSSSSLEWFPYLINKSTNSTRILDPNLPAPSAAELVPLIQQVNALLAALLMFSEQARLFVPLADQDRASQPPVRATYDNAETRLFFNPTMFWLTIALLALNILVAVIFYLRAPRKLLPEMPTTIFAQMRMFMGSSVPAEMAEETQTTRYGYGRFLGLDGKMRIGIEQVPFVQAIA